VVVVVVVEEDLFVFNDTIEDHGSEVGHVPLDVRNG